MAHLVLGVAGAAVGFMVGGPAGAAIGFQLGSMAGTLLFPEKMEGPRLKELTLQDSQYGAAIPVLYGMIRLPGNVIWQTDLQEHEEKSGGKGGPEITNFTYTASFAVLLCAGPILGVRKVWADSRLVWSSESNNEGFQFTLYLGDEEQLPDPTMEAEIGVGEVPAHRGYAYAVFDELALADFGNRIPSLEWEVFTAAGTIPWRVSLFSPFVGTVSSYPRYGATLRDGVITTTGTTSNYGPTSYYQQFRIDGTQIGATTYQVINGVQIYPAGGGVANLNSVVYYYNDVSGSVYNWYNADISTAGLVVGFQLEAFAVAGGNPCVYVDGHVYTVGGNGDPTNFIQAHSAPDGIPGPFEAFTNLDDQYSSSNVMLGSSNTGHVYAMVQTAGGGGGVKLWRYNLDLTLDHFWDVTDTAGTLLQARSAFHVYNDLICYNRAPVTGDKVIALVKIGAGDVLSDYGGQLSHIDADVSNLAGGLMIDRDGVFSLDPPPAPVPLSDIVGDLSLRSGFISAQYDVSQLTDLVAGFKISQQMQTRNAIEPLRGAYFFDGVEIDEQVVFVKRGQSSVVTIADADLAAHEYGAEPPPLLQTIRTQEAELPREVSFDFLDAETDYQISTQLAVRQVTSSESVTTVNVPIVLTQDEGRQKAQSTLFEAWLNRERFSWTTSRKYAEYTPADVMTVQGKDLRVVEKNETPFGIIAWSGLRSRADVYVQVANGIPAIGFVPTVPPGSAPLTTLELLDIPLISDTDIANGHYAGMAPTTDGPWTGATLFKSSDGGTTYSEIAATAVGAVFGRTTGALADFGGGNVFDELSVMEITLDDDEDALESATELAVLNGANPALVGFEIIQFKNAVLTAPGTYLLSGMLRGRRGTEWAASGHTAGDRFVRLPVLDVDAPLGDVGTARLYKAVTFGRTLAGSTAETFTNRGVKLKPYAPVHIGGGAVDSGDVTINWTRRTRIGGDLLDFADVPLGEASEQYVLEIRNESYSLVARVVTGLVAPTFIYTAAMQTTDFGAIQQTIYVTVAQLGLVGIGTRGRGQIAGDGSSVDEPLTPVAPYASPPGPAPGPTNPVNFTLAWNGSNSPHYTSGVVIGNTYVVQFTTDSDPIGPGNIDVAEFGDPATYRTAILSTDTGGTVVIATRYGNSTSMIFGTGVGQVSLSPSTTYYLIVRAQLPDGTPSGTLGSPCDMVITF